MRRYFTLPALAAIGLMVSAGVVRAAQQPLSPGTLITVAGNGMDGFSGDGGPATKASLDGPFEAATDGAGDLFIGDDYNTCVRRVGPDGTIRTVVGMACCAGFSGDGGPATKARISAARGLTFDAEGDLFFSDQGNARVRKVDAAGIITTVAGGGHPADGLGDGGPATAAQLLSPIALALDPSGNLFIADSQAQRVQKVDAAGIITTVAGGGHPADGRGDGGPATDAHLSTLWGLALDPAGNLYLADFADNRVRRVSPDGKIATVAGGGSPADGVGDGGPAPEARLDGPWGLAMDPGGNLFIAENHGERIRRVSPAGIITTVAGTGQVGHSGDGGPATAASLNSPAGVGLDGTGNLFFAECDRYAVHPGASFTNPPPNLEAGFRRFDIVHAGNTLVREVVGVAVPR